MARFKELPATSLLSAIRNFDWARTPLGAALDWPDELIEAVAHVLRVEHPALVAWGPDFHQIYNDAFLPILRERHPLALGQPMRLCWPEAWSVTGPIFDSVLSTGQPMHLTDQPFELMTHDVLETRYFTVDFEPVLLAEGGVGGVQVTSIETTATHLLMAFDR